MISSSAGPTAEFPVNFLIAGSASPHGKRGVAIKSRYGRSRPPEEGEGTNFPSIESSKLK